MKTDAKVRDPRPLDFPSEKLQWIRIRSPHFDVISSASRERTEEIVSDLETVAAVLKRTSSRFQTSPGTTTIFVFSNRADLDAWFELLLGPGDHRLGGAYVRHARGGTMLIDGANSVRIARTAMHELVHDLLRQGDVVPPLWLEEGLAEYFSGARVEAHRVEAGNVVPQHAALLRRQRQLVPLETMFAVHPETDAAASPLFYAQSWAAVDWLMQLDQTKFYDFLQDLERGTPVANALTTHYGKTLSDLESAIRRRGRVSGSTVKFASEEIVKSAPPVDLDRATLLYELGRFLSVIAGAEKDAQRHFAEALRVDPKHAPTLAATGHFAEAVAAAPEDPQVLLAYAESLLETAIGPFAGVFEPREGDVERFRKARALAKHALEIDPNNARAIGDVGVSYLVEGDRRDGIAALQQALALLPRRNDYALNLYAMLLHAGERAKADALFASNFANTHDRQIIFAARNVLLTEEVNRANTLAKSGKLDEAAALIRALAAATEDARARQDLEAQAAELDKTATINRHIKMYNDAVLFVNTNHYADALKILDAILKDATDPLVIADATRLRDELRKKRR